MQLICTLYVRSPSTLAFTSTSGTSQLLARHGSSMYVSKVESGGQALTSAEIIYQPRIVLRVHDAHQTSNPSRLAQTVSHPWSTQCLLLDIAGVNLVQHRVL
jgi:hypothetical protein